MLLREYSFGNYSVQVHDSIQSANADEKWNQITSLNSQLEPSYLKALELSKPEDVTFRYVCIRDQHEIIARVYFQILHFGHRNISVRNSSFLQKLAAVVVRFSPFKIIIGGNLFAVDFSPLDFNAEKILSTDLMQIIIGFIQSEKYDVFVLKDLPTEFTPDVMIPFDLRFFGTDLTMELKIQPEWKTFADYEKALTHKYAQRCRKIRKASTEVQRLILTDELFQKYQERITELFREICSKQSIRMGIVDEKYFIALRNACKDRFRMIGYFIGEKLIAFSSTLEHQEKLEVHYIGLDYTYNKSHALYFNILFDGIEQAILSEKKILELGRTAREAKAVVGCNPVYFNDYLRIRNKFTRRIVSIFQDYFQSEMGDTWKNRHPFK